MDARAERKIDMAIKINLDVVMAQRKTGLTELAEQVDLTLANLSILKTTRRRQSVFHP